MISPDNSRIQELRVGRKERQKNISKTGAILGTLQVLASRLGRETVGLGNSPQSPRPEFAVAIASLLFFSSATLSRVPSPVRPALGVLLGPSWLGSTPNPFKLGHDLFDSVSSS